MAIMLYDRERVLTDNAINICNRLIYDIKSDGSKHLNQQYTDSAPNIQDSFKHIAGIIVYLLSCLLSVCYFQIPRILCQFQDQTSYL
jgi:hypothetical protein